MLYILRNREISCLKQKVIINRMKSIFTIPRDKKEFEKAFSLLIEFGKERKLLTLDDDDEISFAFLLKTGSIVSQTQEKDISRKSSR